MLLSLSGCWFLTHTESMRSNDIAHRPWILSTRSKSCKAHCRNAPNGFRVPVVVVLGVFWSTRCKGRIDVEWIPRCRLGFLAVEVQGLKGCFPHQRGGIALELDLIVVCHRFQFGVILQDLIDVTMQLSGQTGQRVVRKGRSVGKSIPGCCRCCKASTVCSVQVQRSTVCCCY